MAEEKQWARGNWFGGYAHQWLVLQAIDQISNNEQEKNWIG